MRATARLLLLLGAILGLSALATVCLAPWLTAVLDVDAFKIFRRVVTILFLPAVIVYQRTLLHRPLSALGFGTHWRTAGRRLGQGVLIGLVGFLSLITLLVLQGVWQVRLAVPWSTLLLSGVAFVPAALLIGVVEETCFRGLLFSHLREDLPRLAAWLVSSLLFSVVHFIKSLHQPLAILPQAIGLFLLGLLLADAYQRTGTLYLAIGLHAVLAYLAKMDRAILTFIGRDPEWLYGNDRWISGMMGWVVLGGVWWGVRRLTPPVITQSASPSR